MYQNTLQLFQGRGKARPCLREPIVLQWNVTVSLSFHRVHVISAVVSEQCKSVETPCIGVQGARCIAAPSLNRIWRRALKTATMTIKVHHAPGSDHVTANNPRRLQRPIETQPILR